MSRQDKATTERNARILRDLVKQPDNKACADCRKNDARWASWNLGVYLCIRCSGIHRSMGTHISKVKSIDLDIWTPEQMEHIQKWGNRRANLYWERHLKVGHVPPEHKIESFIRSKYESRRWAMDGPPPADPSTLETGGASSVPPTSPPRPTPTSSAPAAAPASRAHPLLSRQAKPTSAAPAAPTLAPVVDLIGGDEPAPPAAPTFPPRAAPAPAATSALQPAPTTAAAGPAPTAPTNGSSIFDLDFRAPTPSTKPQSNKADIMSLFSTPSPSTAPPQQSFFSQPAPSQPNPYASWGGGVTSSAPPVQQQFNQAPVPAAAHGGSSGWGGLQMDQGGWGAPVQAQQPPTQSPPAAQTQNNFWANPAADPWASGSNGSAGAMGGFGLAPAVTQKKEEKLDPFANIWQ